MSKILSYNKKTTGEGWISLHNQYGADEINMIIDPNAGLSQKPRTAIPSPFAQMDLVKNAFNRLAMSTTLEGEVMDKLLVSNALDIAQLFFNFGEMKNQLRVVEWNKDKALSDLKNNVQHTLLGETISMFLEQDKEAFNFDKFDKLYFLLYENKVIGSTSPITLFMATPNAQPGKYPVTVEQNINLFDSVRHLHCRDTRFIKYLYAMFNAYPQLKQYCGEVNAYLVRVFELLSAEIRNEILTEIGNPTSLDLENIEKAKLFLQTNYLAIDGGVQIFGIPFYGLRQEDVLDGIASSDFVINTKKAQNEPLPLVLQNNLSSYQSVPYKYITGNWDDKQQISYTDYAEEPSKRTLPGTSHVYPWLTDDDFFQPSLIKLDYTLNRDCYFDGNLSLSTKDVDDNDFLLPIKPLFFKYFDVEDLKGKIGGLPKFEMRHERIGGNEALTAILRIPVKKEGGFITLKRTYLKAIDNNYAYDRKNDKGYFVNIAFTLNLFPFIKTEGINHYNVQLIDRALGDFDSHGIGLSFYKETEAEALDTQKVNVRERSYKKEKRVGSSYYKVDDNFDYILVNLSSSNSSTPIEGLICPNWTSYIPGHDSYTFAVDFGTTNTHVESMQAGALPQPLMLNSVAVEKMVATLYNGSSILYDVILKQEFLPKCIGEDYCFPQRTVLSESERLDIVSIDHLVPLGDTNIPFIYEKESVGYGNNIVTDLKWSVELSSSKRVKAFLTELALLMRTKVLLEHGDLSKISLVWFYPLSMKIGNVRKLGEMWESIFAEVFGVQANNSNLIHMPESVAPYYFYKNLGTFRGAASTVASIDIGGGSSDIAIFKGTEAQPLLLSSFRFAANALFGDGFSDIPRGNRNPMVTTYVNYFKRLFDADDDKYGELNGILDDITEKQKSDEINAFLFSIINNQAVLGNDVFSYNKRLNEDAHRKIIFLYFYSALIYYVANVMKHHNIDKPRNVMFSGTGSKVLDIVGSQRDLDMMTQAIFERVYNETYTDSTFSVVMERREPKQITCRGALMQMKAPTGTQLINELNNIMDGFDNTIKVNYSLLDKEQLTYGDMDDTAIQQGVITKVKEFNSFFIELCDALRVVDRFLVDNQSYQKFKAIVNNDLDHHLVTGWNFINKNAQDKNKEDIIEDTMFFYPIIGTIRDNLIEGLTN